MPDRAISQIGTDADAMLPEGMTIESVADQAASARSEVYSNLLAYLDSKISIAVFGQTLTTQEGSSGSYALGQVHNLIRQDIEHADGRRHCERSKPVRGSGRKRNNSIGNRTPGARPTGA